MTRRRTAQRGFTLFEVMVAVTISSAVLTPAMAMLFTTIEWSTQANSHIRLNQQARQMFDILGNGARMAEAGDDGVPYAYGLRGLDGVPPGKWRKDYQLEFKSNKLTATSDGFALQHIDCSGTAAPLPSCKNDKGHEHVRGYLAADPEIEDRDRSVDSRTVEISVTLTDPFQAQRLENPAEATETYRTVFSMALAR